MHRDKVIVGATLGLSLLAAIISLMLPLPPGWNMQPIDFYLPLAGYSMTACIYVGAALLFTINLDAYKAKLRQAYVTVAVGIIISAVGLLQIPVIQVLDATQSFWVHSGIIVLPFLLANLIMYLGIRYHARLIGIIHPLSRVWLAIPIALAITIAAAFLPHVATDTSELAYGIGIGVTAWGAGMILFAAILAFSIRQRTGAHYRQAMTWLALVFFANFFILGVQFFRTLLTTETTDLLSKIMIFLAIVGAAMWLRASYVFARTKDF